jgi:hypothetical protein
LLTHSPLSFLPQVPREEAFRNQGATGRTKQAEEAKERDDERSAEVAARLGALSWRAFGSASAFGMNETPRFLLFVFFSKSHEIHCPPDEPCSISHALFLFSVSRVCEKSNFGVTKIRGSIDFTVISRSLLPWNNRGPKGMERKLSS